MKDRIKNAVLDILDNNPGDMLTVKLLCAEAGISKQTLYNYYYGITAALEDLIDDLMDESFDDAFDHTNVKAAMSVLRVMNEHQKVFLHLYSSKRYHDEMMRIIGSKMRAITERSVDKCISEKDADISEFSRNIVVGFYLDLYMGVIDRYLSAKMSYDSEAIGSIYDAIMYDHSTQEALIRLSTIKL